MSENLNETMTVAGNGTIIPITTAESSCSNSSVSKTTSTINAAATGDHQTQSSTRTAFVPRSHDDDNNRVNTNTSSTNMIEVATLKTMNLALIGQVQQLMKEKEQESLVFTNKIDSLTKELNISLFEINSLKDELYQAKKNQEKRVLDLQKEVSTLNKQALDDKDRIGTFNKQASIDKDRIQALEKELKKVQKTNKKLNKQASDYESRVEAFNKQASIDKERIEALETELKKVQKTNKKGMNKLKEKVRNDKKKIMDLQKDLENVRKQKEDAMKYIMGLEKELGRLQKGLHSHASSGAFDEPKNFIAWATLIESNEKRREAVELYLRTKMYLNNSPDYDGSTIGAIIQRQEKQCKTDEPRQEEGTESSSSKQEDMNDID